MPGEQGEAAGGSVCLTAELLEQLLASATPEQYLARASLEERSLAEYAEAVREAHGLKKSVRAQPHVLLPDLRGHAAPRSRQRDYAGLWAGLLAR